MIALISHTSEINPLFTAPAMEINPLFTAPTPEKTLTKLFIQFLLPDDWLNISAMKRSVACFNS